MAKLVAQGDIFCTLYNMNPDIENQEYGDLSTWYRKYYPEVIFGGGFGASAVKKTHKVMEKSFHGQKFDRVLEVGGGNGEHLDFILHAFNTYELTDLRMPELPLKWRGDSRITPRIANAESLPYPDLSFDRVIVTCLLHHVECPELVMSEVNRVLKENGIATIFLSCDPGLAVRTLRKFTVARKAKKLGFTGHALMVARDHRNHVQSLLEMARYVFRNRKLRIRFFPFGLPSWNLNGYVVINVSKA